MMLKLFFSLLLFLLCCQQAYSEQIGVLIMATGKYINFVPRLINSAEEFFCKNHKVTYYVFTDGILEMPSSTNVITIFQERLGWPYDTMNRYHVYLKHASMLSSNDYLFSCDADMLFVGNVGDEILGKRVATQHPGFVGKRGSYESNPLSLACIHSWEGEQYFAGGFYGGTADEVLKMAKINAKNIDTDLENGIIAVWHDESHWNRYCIDYKPTVILTPSYCYPESWNLNYEKKLLALDKNHTEYRGLESRDE